MRKFVLAVGLLVAGCGSSDGGSNGGSNGSAASSLEGLWQVTLANGCVGSYQFSGSNFTDNLLCALANGNYGAESESGTFTTGAGEIDFVPTKSSCPADAKAESVPYAIQGQNLVITGSDGTQIIFQKTTPGTVQGGAVIQNGCWDVDASGQLTLTPHPIQSL